MTTRTDEEKEKLAAFLFRKPDPFIYVLEAAHYEVTAAQRHWYAFDRACRAHERIMAKRRRGIVDEHAEQEAIAESRSLQLEILQTIDAFLVVTGRLSLLLFPIPKKGDSRRGERLRTIAGIDATSPLASRAVRDAFAHHDERIDRAIRDYGSDFNIDCFGYSHDAAIDRSAVLRFFEIDTRCIYILGKRYELLPLRQGIDVVEAGLKAYRQASLVEMRALHAAIDEENRNETAGR